MKINNRKQAIDAKAIWTVGKGFKSPDQETEIILDSIIGWGTDTFDTIIKNMIIVRQICGDAYAEVIRKENGRLLNLKPLDPSSMKIVTNKKGVIIRYEQINKTEAGIGIKRFEPHEIFHLSRHRVGDEIHGVGVIESVEATLLRYNQALDDFNTVLHRNVHPPTVVEVDTEDQTEIDALVAKYEKMIKHKDVLFVPKGNVSITREGLSNNATMNPMPWIEYHKNFFFQAVGIPQIIVGGSQEFTEATAKIAYLSFQQTVEDEQRDIETQMWAQLALKVEFEFPASLENELLSDQAKDSTSGAVKPNEVTTTMEGKT